MFPEVLINRFARTIKRLETVGVYYIYGNNRTFVTKLRSAKKKRCFFNVYD